MDIVKRSRNGCLVEKLFQLGKVKVAVKMSGFTFSLKWGVYEWFREMGRMSGQVKLCECERWNAMS